MEYEIIWAAKAAKQLARLDRPVAKRIYEKVGQLRTNPERYDEKLVGYPYYRLRVGDYRVILDIKRESLRILVLMVGHRSRICELPRPKGWGFEAGSSTRYSRSKFALGVDRAPATNL
jgi:Cytotoxic translational repressor of toxin-antitoxin stability system